MARSMTPISNEFSFVNVQHHEGSTIFSFEAESALPWEILKDTVTSLIDRIQQEVDKQDGIVGHIKAFAEDEGGSCGFTATGGDIHTKFGKPRTTKLHFVAIVFVENEDTILQITEEALALL